MELLGKCNCAHSQHSCSGEYFQKQVVSRTGLILMMTMMTMMTMMIMMIDVFMVLMMVVVLVLMMVITVMMNCHSFSVLQDKMEIVSKS